MPDGGGSTPGRLFTIAQKSLCACCWSAWVSPVAPVDHDGRHDVAALELRRGGQGPSSTPRSPVGMTRTRSSSTDSSLPANGAMRPPTTSQSARTTHLRPPAGREPKNRARPCGFGPFVSVLKRGSLVRDRWRPA